MVQNGIVTRPTGGQMTVQEVANLLGVARRADGKYHLIDLINAANLNMWSARKPVRYPTKAVNLTDADMADVDYGFDTGQYSGIYVEGVDELAAFLTRAINALGQWTYLRPRGRISASVCEWLRFLDFERYNHNAIPPYYINGYGTPLQLEVGGALQLDVTKATGANAEIDLEDMGIFLNPDTEHQVSDYRLGVILRTGYGNPKIFLTSATLDQLFIQNLTEFVNIVIPLSYGTTYCQFVFTTIDPQDIDPTSHEIVADPSSASQDAGTIWLPKCYKVIEVNPNFQIMAIFPGWEWGGGAGEYFFQIHANDEQVPQYIDTRVNITNNDPDTGSENYVDVYLDYYFDYGGGTSQIYTAHDEVTVGEPGDVVLDTFRLTIPSGYSSESDFYADNIYVRLRWEWDGNTRYYDFSSGLPSRTNPGFVNLGDLLDTYADEIDDQ